MTFWRQSQGKAQPWSDTIPSVSGKKVRALEAQQKRTEQKQNVMT